MEHASRAGRQAVIQLYQANQAIYFTSFVHRTHSSMFFAASINMCLCVDLSRQNLSRTQNCVIVDNKQTKHTYEQLTTPNGAFYF